MPDLPTKAQQEAEAALRAEQRGGAPPDPIDTSADVEATGPTDPPAPAPQRQAPLADPEPAPRTPRLSPNEQKRADISARFRAGRGETEDAEGETDADQIRRFTNEGLPPELADLEAPPPAPAQEPPAQEPPAPAPQKRKLIVRGKEMEVTDEELLALAQKSAAGDDYLAETRRLLDEAKALRNSNSVPRADQPAHPGPTSAQTTELSLDHHAGDLEHPEDPYVKLVEQIQFGDPQESAQALKRAIETVASEKSGEASRAELARQRMRDEAVRSNQILQDFQGQHPDLANDENAVAVMEKRLYRLQMEDLAAIGLTEAQMPKSPTEIAKRHMEYRTNGYKVRDVPTLLTQVRDDFLSYLSSKGAGQTPTPNPKPADPATPRIEVKIDREARRQAIPQQPTRTVAPKPDAVSQPAPQRDRSDVVKNMMLARGKPRGMIMPA